jgi:hypothetical protein
MDKIQSEILHPFLHLQAEMENTYREKLDFFFILRGCSRRNGYFPAEMLKILTEMVHPFLHL